MQDWPETRRLFHAEKMPTLQIAEKLEISTNTFCQSDRVVRAAEVSPGAKGLVVDLFVLQIMGFTG